MLFPALKTQPLQIARLSDAREVFRLTKLKKFERRHSGLDPCRLLGSRCIFPELYPLLNLIGSICEARKTTYTLRMLDKARSRILGDWWRGCSDGKFDVMS